jgi:hypothetical protein
MESLLRDTQEHILLLLDYDSIWAYAKANPLAAKIVRTREFWKKKIRQDTRVEKVKPYFKEAVFNGWVEIVRELLTRDEIKGIKPFPIKQLALLCPFEEDIDNHFEVLKLLIQHGFVSLKGMPKYDLVHPKVVLYLEPILGFRMRFPESQTAITNNLDWLFEYLALGGGKKVMSGPVIAAAVNANRVDLVERIGELGDIGRVDVLARRVSEEMKDALQKYPNIFISLPKRKVPEKIERKEPLFLTDPKYVEIWNIIKNKDVRALTRFWRNSEETDFSYRIYYETERGNSGNFFLNRHSLDSISDYLENPIQGRGEGYDYAIDFVTDTITYIDVFEY